MEIPKEETVESTDAVVTETPATTTEEVVESSSTTEEKTDFSDLIEQEKGRGKPDPEKARERFKSKEKASEEEEEVDEEDKPMTRREAREFMQQESHQMAVESNEDRIIELSDSLSESPQEAELIREIHKNRVYPQGMPLREQLAEAHATANYKREQAKSAELARTIQSQETVSHDTATTHRDPQPGVGPTVESDLAASMKRAGFVLNNTTNRYEKTLPSGKILVKEPGKSPYMAQ